MFSAQNQESEFFDQNSFKRRQRPKHRRSGKLDHVQRRDRLFHTTIGLAAAIGRIPHPLSMLSFGASTRCIGELKIRNTVRPHAEDERKANVETITLADPADRLTPVVRVCKLNDIRVLERSTQTRLPEGLAPAGNSSAGSLT